MHKQYYRLAKLNPDKTQDAELERFFGMLIRYASLVMKYGQR